MNAAGHVDEITYLDSFSPGNGEGSRRVPKGAVICVRGWAAFLGSNEKPTGVYLSIDGGPPIEALYGEEREDVARAIGDESLVECGFRALFSTAYLAAGDHGVTLSIRDFAGRRVVVDDSAGFCVADDDHRRALAEAAEEPAAIVHVDSLIVDGKVEVEPVCLSQTSVLEIEGWAFDEVSRAAATSVFAVVDSFAVKATYGFARPDVAAAHDSEEYLRSGFSLHVPMDRISPGSHRLAIRVLGADGKTVFRGASVRITVSSPLVAVRSRGGDVTRGSIDDAIVYDVDGAVKPSHVPLKLLRGERLLLRGWAVDERSDRVAGAVAVCVDDLPATPAVYKIDRVDVARALGRPDLQACGFLGIVSTITLQPGAHVASISVTSGDGRTAYELGQSVEFLVGETA